MLVGLWWAAACSSPGAGEPPQDRQIIRCSPGAVRNCPGAPACETQAIQECFPTGEGWSTCRCWRVGAGGGGAGAPPGGGGAAGDVGEAGSTSLAGQGGRQ